MNNLLAEMIGEITQWLQIADIKTARLVWHNIEDDPIDIYTKYIKCLVKRKDMCSDVLKKKLSHPLVNAIYVKTGHMVINSIFVDVCNYTFDKNLGLDCKKVTMKHDRNIGGRNYNDGTYDITSITSKLVCKHKLSDDSDKRLGSLGIYTQYKMILYNERLLKLYVLHDFDRSYNARTYM